MLDTSAKVRISRCYSRESKAKWDKGPFFDKINISYVTAKMAYESLS